MSTKAGTIHRSHRGRQNAKNPSLLTGKAVDESGTLLIPTHAAKGSRRYRYYVSRNLIEKSDDANREGLRIPAPELEGAVIRMIIDSLGDDGRLLEDLDHPSISIWQEAKRQVGHITNTLEQRSIPEKLEILQSLVDRISVTHGKIGVSLRRKVISTMAGDSGLINLSCPVSFRRSGFGIKLVIPGRDQPITRQVDQRLLNLVQRGTAWFHQLVTEGIGPKTIAKVEGLSESLVQRMIYAAFLAPDIVKVIERGEQPASLTSRTLLDALPLPLRFEDQRKLFGITA